MQKSKRIAGLASGLILCWFAWYSIGERIEPTRSEFSAAPRLSGAETVAGDMQAEPPGIVAVARVNNAASPARPGDWASPVETTLFSSFAGGSSYREFVAANRAVAEAGDADAQYLVAKAVLDCLTFHRTYKPGNAQDPFVSDHVQQLRSESNQRMDELCGGFDFDDEAKRQEWSQWARDLLKKAAENGNPAAMANELMGESQASLFSDDLKVRSEFDDLARDILATGDPFAVRKLSEYYSRALSEYPMPVPEGTRLGAHQLTVRLGFELAACSLGYPCDSSSPMVLRTCAQLGHACEPGWSYPQMLEMVFGPMVIDDASRIQLWVLQLLREGRLDELRRYTG